VTPRAWPCPLAVGTAEAHALTFDDFRRCRLLIVPALFDEANRMRRFTVEVMRRLDGAGIDCVLPDLPGTNESLQPLERQTPDLWREAMAAAAKHFRASHVLGIRGGALVTPPGLPTWHYAPVKGGSQLRTMLRARILSSREAGRSESQEDLLEQGLTHGIELAGHRLGPEFIRQFQALAPAEATVIDQDVLGGSGLWLRAEPGEDRAQADALAAILTIGIKS